jgi:hypothetical protein
MAINSVYEFWHFNRLQFSLMAATLTAASSIVLLGYISSNAVLINTLGTFAIYGLDDLIDAKQDKKKYPQLERWWPVKFFLFLAIAPIGLIYLLILSINGGGGFLLFIMILGIFSVIFNFIPFIQENAKIDVATPTAKALLVSFTWAVICVLSPVQYEQHRITIQTLMALVFVWQLTFVSAIIWRMALLENNVYNKTKDTHFVIEPLVIKRLKLLCLLSATLAIIDIILGYFPWHNIIVVLSPVCMWLLLNQYHRFLNYKQVYSDVIVTANTLCSMLVIAVYLLVPK